ncbi:MAG: glycosyltransferase family 4 protein [Promethearchaeota archaeon]
MKKKLAILVVSGTYPPDIGGSELSLHAACTGLLKKGHDIMVIADDRRPSNYEVEGVPVIACPPKELNRVLESIHSNRKVDLILTQLIYSLDTLKWAKIKNIPLIYFLRNNEMKIDLSTNSDYSPDIVVANSNFTAKNARKKWNREINVIYPLIDLTKTTPRQKRPEYITMINPLVLKGGKMFYDLAKHFAERKFLTVKGWTSLRDRKDGSWDPRQWELIAKAHEDPSVHPPEEVDFSDLPNVTCLQSTQNIQEVYEKTLLLLFPSSWEEAFGRVVLEALTVGIPVIANNVGGTSETGLKNGGILMKKNSTLNDWIKAIEMFNDLKTYRSFSQKAKKDSRWYSLENELNKLEALCLSLTT